MSHPENNNILNGDDTKNSQQDPSMIRSSVEDIASHQNALKSQIPNNENFVRPPLTRLDSRSNVLIRPGYPNQSGVQFRPPPRPGAPQFMQRPPTARPPLGQQQQQYPTNLGPRTPNVGIRPGTPYPRQPLPNTAPRPQIYTPSKTGNEQVKNLDSTNITSLSSDDNSDINVSPIQNTTSNQSINKTLQEEPTDIPENRIREKSEEYSTNRTDSRSNLYMNRIDEDEQQDVKAEISMDNSPNANHPLESVNNTKNQRKEDEKPTIARPSSAMRMSKTPSEERPLSVLKSPVIEKPSDLSPRTRKVPNNFNGSLKSPKSEGDNDSGVDESTQGNDQSSNGDNNSPRKSSGRVSARNVQSPTKPRSLSRGSKSPLPKSPDSATSSTIGIGEKKKVPMNKVQVGAAPSPNLKEVKSKIGSLQNSNYRPGGGNIKIENKKIDFKATPRIAAKNENYAPKGGDKRNVGSSSYREIPQQKLQWNAKSKIGSFDNTSHKPKGGDKKIESVKLDFKERAKSKVGSKDNIKHMPGGGDVKFEDDYMDNKMVKSQIESKKIDIKAEAKVGSLDNVKHKPKGGDKKIFDDKEYIRQMSAQQNDHQSFGGSQFTSMKSPEVNLISPSEETIRILGKTNETATTPRSRPSSRLSRTPSLRKPKSTPTTPSTPNTPKWRF